MDDAARNRLTRTVDNICAGEGSISDFSLVVQELGVSYKTMNRKFLQACEEGNVALANLMLQIGADKRTRNEDGFCAAQVAVTGDKPETLKWLRERHFDILCLHETPSCLSLAMTRTCPEVIKYYVNENLAAAKDFLFASIAYYRGSMETVDFLLDRAIADGADLAAMRNNVGGTLVQVAREYIGESIMPRLEALGLDTTPPPPPPKRSRWNLLAWVDDLTAALQNT